MDTIQDEFAHAVIEGLSNGAKQIPCRFLYDARGSELFEEITELDEYYPTRTEIGLLQNYGAEIGEMAGPGCALVEFGSGSSRKTRILIDHLEEIAAYVPIDIADEALNEAADRLETHYPELDVLPVHADFNQDIDLPDRINGTPKLGFFPGSTIGNFDREGVEQFLSDAAALLGEKSSFLVGVDLKKSSEILLPAYDDAKGVTAEFILNLLHRINNELDGNIDLTKFDHQSVYNEEAGRVELYIVSLEGQQISVQGQTFDLKKGERIHIENSHKFSVDEFQALAESSGWTPAQVWTDDRKLFSLHYLERA